MAKIRGFVAKLSVEVKVSALLAVPVIVFLFPIISSESGCLKDNTLYREILSVWSYLSRNAENSQLFAILRGVIFIVCLGFVLRAIQLVIDRKNEFLGEPEWKVPEGFIGALFSVPLTVVLSRLLIVAAISVGVAYCIRSWVFDGPVLVDVASGTIQFRDFKNSRQAVFALSAAQGWSSTEVRVEKGDTITFGISGGTNAAIHRLVESAIYDTVPPCPWAHRPGTGRGKRPTDNLRNEWLLKPDTPISSILGYICCDKNTCPDMENPATIENARKANFVVASPQNQYQSTKFKSDCDGVLYLAYNDSYISERKHYIFSPEKMMEAANEKVSEYREKLVERMSDLQGILMEGAWYSLVCRDKIKNAINGKWWGKLDEGKSVELFESCAKKIVQLNSNNGSNGGNDTDSNGAISLSTIQNALDSGSSIQDLTFLGCPKDEKRGWMDDANCIAALNWVAFSMRWEMSVKDNRTLWFDDNVGMYLVIMEMK